MNQQHTQLTLADARELFRQKSYSEALELCETLLAGNDHQADVLTLKALVHKQLGEFEDAGTSIEMALSQDPDNVVMLFTGSLINLKLENFDTAKKQAMKAAREAPDNPQINCQCAMILGSLGEPQLALQLLEKFVQKNHDHAQAWYLIGKSQDELDNHEAAEYALRECIALEPGHVNASKRLAAIGQTSSG